MAFKMKCYRTVLKLCCKNKVTSKIVREKVVRHCTIVNWIKQRKRKLLDDMSRMKDE